MTPLEPKERKSRITKSLDNSLIQNISEFDAGNYTDSAHEGKLEAKSNSSLLPDLFQLAYKINPSVVDKTSDKREGDRRILEALSETPEYRDLHKTTQVNTIASAIGALALAQQIELNKEKIKEDLAQGDGEGKARKALKKAAKEAEAETIESTDLIGGLFPGTEDTDKSDNSDLSTILELVDIMKRNQQVQETMQQFGRLRSILKRSKKFVYRKGVGSIKGIEMGRDITRYLPVELAFIGHPKLQPIGMQRYIRRSALQYRTMKKVTLGKGPIIHCVDCSGSMQSNSKMSWAHAVSLALLEQARIEKRDAKFILFNTAIKAEFTFPKGKQDLAKTLGMVSTGPGGNTEFTRVLDAAAEETKISEFEFADILITTDGHGRLEESTVRNLKNLEAEKGLTCYSIQIEDRMSNKGTEVLKRFCNPENMYLVGERVQNDDKALSEVFAGIARPRTE
tara:strand:- start:3939 stop:5297 length:1359 start_codon:yes stop_codon:yes gene_type:complete